MMSAMTLTEFLLARIADDEARDPEYGFLLNSPPIETGHERAIFPDEIAAADAEQAKWEKRWQADVDAKRRIAENDERNRTDLMRETDTYSWTTRVLAAIYADHPDYDETWRP